MIIRRARVEDAGPLASVHAHAWQWAYRGQLPEDALTALVDPDSLARREANWRQSFSRESTEDRTWLADEGGRIVGFAGTGPSRDSEAPPGTGELGSIYLDEDYAGKGIGRALLSHALADLRQRGFRRATLWVLETNHRARRFYEIAGWRPDGALKVEDWRGVPLREVRYAIDLDAVSSPL